MENYSHNDFFVASADWEEGMQLPSAAGGALGTLSLVRKRCIAY